jgi:hypothetical protein
MGKFWESVAGSLSDRWAAVAGPAIVFWVGVVAAWLYHQRSLDPLTTATGWLDKQTIGGQVLVLVGVLAVVAASAMLVERATTPMLRWLEGYWPPGLGWLRSRGADWQRRRATKDAQKMQTLWAELDDRPLPAGSTDSTTPKLSVGERATARQRLSSLEARTHQRPADSIQMMPSRIGNILRAAETRPRDRYGLDPIIVWPRLWLVLPDTARSEVAAARTALDGSVAAVIWALLFCLATPLAWWALPVGLAIAAVTWLWWIPARASTYGDLMESCFDLYRKDLYTHLRLPAPTSSATETAHGDSLTNYLWRGPSQENQPFTDIK